MKGALWVCERDIRKFLKQPVVMMSALLAPFLMLVLLGNAFGGTIEHVPVAITSDSVGAYSLTIIETLQAEKNMSPVEVPELDTAQHFLKQGRVKAIIYFPSGFDDSLQNGEEVFLTLYLDNTDPLSAQAVYVYIRDLSTRALAQRISSILLLQSKITVDATNYYRGVEYIEFMAPGSIIQAIFIASIIGGGISILFDKQRGVLEGYLVTPLKQYEIVVGVLFAGVIKAMFSSLTMLFLAITIAGVRPMTDFTGFLLMLFTIFLTGLGLISMMTAFAVRAPSPEVYQFTAFPINLILYFTSGAIYPIEGFPDWMRTIAVVNPEAYAVHALRLLMYKGANFGAVAGDFAFLAVFTVFMVGIATLAFKRAL
jgi:ABC-2 type transport system permease protein